MLTLKDVDDWLCAMIIEFFNFQKQLSADADERKNRKQNVFAILNAKLRFWASHDCDLYLPEPEEVHNSKTSDKGILKFTNKELNAMPEEIKKILKQNDHIRQKENGVYEIRLTFNGNKYYGSSKNFNEAKRQFFESIINTGTQAQKSLQHKKNSILVKDYAFHYLETFKKPNVCEENYKNHISQIKNHIAPHFDGVLISQVTATMCQQLLNKVLQEGKGRLAEDLNSLLKWICEAALSDGILTVNPMGNVKIPKHFRAEGKQIPVQIMAQYLAKSPENRSDYCIWLITYSGIRPCELKTVIFDNGFMTIKNAKQSRNKKSTFRRIPIHSALLPYIDEIKKSITMNTDVLAQAFKRRFPKEYHLYELRHTFTSRVQECGANKSWVDYATNHVGNQNTTDKVYTHWSDTFQVSEIEKLHF